MNSTTSFLASQADDIECAHSASGNISDGSAVVSVNANEWGTASLSTAMQVNAGDPILVFCADDESATSRVYTTVTATFISSNTSSATRAAKGRSTERHQLPAH